MSRPVEMRDSPSDLREAMRKDTGDLIQCMFASWFATLVYMAALLIALDRR